MENIEKNVVLLLNGKDAEEPQDFCDFTLEDQNEAASKYQIQNLKLISSKFTKTQGFM
jgi:hypothetical protein